MKRIGHCPVLILAVWFVIHGRITAAEIVSAQSGNWGSGATWAGGVVPTRDDSVTILSGDTVVVESSGKNCHNLTIEDGGVLYTNNPSTGSNPRYIYIYGNIICNGTIGNGSTYDLIGFNIEGDSCMISGSGRFNASRIRKYLNDFDTSTLIISCLTTLRIGGTALYNNRSGTVFQVIIEAGDTLNVTGDGITPGNVAIDGINGGASSTGGGSITVSGTLMVSGILYLTNSNSSNSASVTVAGGGLIETASISCPNSGNSGHIFTVEDGGTLNLKTGDWGEVGFSNNTYSFLPGSTVIYSGDTAQTIGNPSGYHHLTLLGAGVKILHSDMVFGGNLTINGGSVLTVDAGTALTVSGSCSFTGTGCLLLKSPADAGVPASFIPNGGVSGTGTVQIERYLKKYLTPDDSRYHMLSSPVTAQSIQPGFVADPPEAGTDFYRWGEQEGVWVNSKDESGSWNTSFQPGDDRTFLPGRGYLGAYPEDELKLFDGSLIASDLSPTITYTEGDFAGFTLLGNPFSSALTAEIDNWAKSDVDNAVWVWDGEAGNYKNWNGSVGSLSGGIIPAMQGFFVHGNGPSPSITIPATSRVHASQPYYKDAPRNTLSISLFQGILNDGITLTIDASAIEGYDPQQDVLKLYGASDAPQLFWIEEDANLSINVTPGKSSGLELSIGFVAGVEGEYRMLFTGEDSFENGEDLFLEDHMEEKSINLHTNSEYLFKALPGLDDSRFTIRLGDPEAVPDDNPEQVIFITTEGNRIVFHGLESTDEAVPVYLYDLTGNQILTTTATGCSPVIETNLAQGFYIIRLISSRHSLSRKIYLKPLTN